jgi:hypothetical protein
MRRTVHATHPGLLWALDDLILPGDDLPGRVPCHLTHPERDRPPGSGPAGLPHGLPDRLHQRHRRRSHPELHHLGGGRHPCATLEGDVDRSSAGLLSERLLLRKADGRSLGALCQRFCKTQRGLSSRENGGGDQPTDGVSETGPTSSFSAKPTPPLLSMLRVDINKIEEGAG